MSAPQTFRAIDSDNDWVFGRGVSSYLKNSDAIAADIKTALQIFMGEVFWQTQFGVDWWNLLGGKNPSAQAGIILQTRQIILSVDGVTQINSVSVSFTRGTRALALNWDVNTIFTQNITGSITPA